MRPRAAALLLTIACGAPSPTPAPVADTPAPFSEPWLLAQADRYLSEETSHRRRALERSLRNPANHYSRTRLGSYGHTTLGWDLLPPWNPRTLPVTAARIAELRERRLDLTAATPLWDGQRPRTLAAWVALGERVFFSYPLRPEIFAEHALANPDVARAVGLGRAPDGSVPGVVALVDVDGRDRVGITCAICHVALEDGAMVVGRARRDFDYGAMRLAFHRETGAPLDARQAERMAAWGPGRADITEDDDEDPVAIPDLWQLAELEALTQAGTLRHVDLGEDAPLALAIDVGDAANAGDAVPAADDTTMRTLYATDASAYREMPQAVAIPQDIEDLKVLIRFANTHKTSLIPRTAGTSLAGQVVGNGIVVDVSRTFTKILEINAEERWVRVQPGVVRDELNMALKPYGLYFGPETSTANRAMIGGMVGNNSCGSNSVVYGSTREHLLEVKALLADGSEATFGSLSPNGGITSFPTEGLEGAIYATTFEILSDRENQEEIRKNFPKKSIERRNTGYALDML